MLNNFNQSNGTILIDSFADLRALKPQFEGQIVKLLGWNSGSTDGNGEFIGHLTSGADDGGKIASNGSYHWERKEYLIGQPIKPEWYGCTGLGSASPDTTNFLSMINGLAEGDVVELGIGKEYYNADPNGTQWLITINNITFVGNGSTLSKRASTTSDNFTLILDVNNVTGFYLLGSITLNGNEPLSEIYDTTATSLNSGVNYCNSPCQSFCLRVQNSTDVSIGQDIKMTRAVFCSYFNAVTDLTIKGTYTYSGQVYPLTGTDLALGSAAKINACIDINADIIAKNCAYSGLEFEGSNYDGFARCIGTNVYEASVHFQSTNSNFTVDAIGTNNKQYVLFLGAGSLGITGKAKGRNCGSVCFAYGAAAGQVVSCNIEINSNNSFYALRTYSQDSGNNVTFCNFDVTNYSTATTGSIMTISNTSYSKVIYRGIGGVRAMTMSSGNYNDFIIKVPYGTGTVYQAPGYYNNYDITSFQTSEAAANATRYNLRYEQNVIEGAVSITSNSPETAALRYNTSNLSQFITTPNLASGSTMPSTVPLNGQWIDTANGNVIKVRKS